MACKCLEGGGVVKVHGRWWQELKGPGNTHPGWSDPDTTENDLLYVIILCGCRIPRP